MEEGTPPSPASRPPIPPPPAASADNDFPSTVVHGYPPPLTYIVQVPKDQIYRVPPQENARLAQQYHAHITSLRKQRSPCLNFFLRFLCIFAIVSLPLLTAALVFYIVVRPTAPILHIDGVAIESKAQCEIFMEATNPSVGMGYLIEEGVERGTKLSYEGRSLADGESPQLNLKAGESRRFRLALHEVRKAALEEMKKVAELRLVSAAPVRVEIWGMRLWGMTMKVECDVRVTSSGKGMKVLSHDCKVVIELVRS